MKTHTFNRRKYHIHIGPFLGLTDAEDDGKLGMWINSDLHTQNGLIVAVHEAIHACDWKAPEEKVEIMSKDIGRFLWRLGYRCKRSDK